jgi:hypothetical protein
MHKLLYIMLGIIMMRLVMGLPQEPVNKCEPTPEQISKIIRGFQPSELFPPIIINE